MGLFKRKPFAILSLIIGAVLLILACTTVQHACYDQLGILSYGKILSDSWCKDECGDDRAIKKVAIQGNTPFDPVATHPSISSTTAGLRRIVRCPWARSTNRIFLAFSTLLCLWLVLEVLLGAYRKYHFFFNIFIIALVGLAIPTAVYQWQDIEFTNCDRDVFGLNAASGMEYSLCYFSLFNVSFILTIVVMLTLLAQLIFNVVNRNKINEKENKYANVPQQSAATEPVVVVQQSAAERDAENRVV